MKLYAIEEAFLDEPPILREAEVEAEQPTRFRILHEQAGRAFGYRRFIPKETAHLTAESAWRHFELKHSNAAARAEETATEEHLLVATAQRELLALGAILYAP